VRVADDHREVLSMGLGKTGMQFVVRHGFPENEMILNVERFCRM
jgi:hypothetical protein